MIAEMDCDLKTFIDGKGGNNIVVTQHRFRGQAIVMEIFMRACLCFSKYLDLASYSIMVTNCHLFVYKIGGLVVNCIIPFT